MPSYLVQIDGFDPVAAGAVSLFAASDEDDRICHLNGQAWWPSIAELPALRYDLVDAGFSGAIETPSSTLSLAVEAWPNFARYALADARIRLWSGNPGDAWGSWTLRFDGRVTGQPAIADGIARLTIAVDDRWLDTPLLALYAGTGGAEGDAARKGQPKPLSIGAPRYVPGELVDSANVVLQLSSFAIEDVEQALEGLAAFGTPTADFATYAALVAATVPPGAWATAKAVGMVRHGAPAAPGRRFTYKVKGDKGGAGGWVRLPGAIIKRLALLAGGTGKTHDASLAALDTARPWNISWHMRDQITAREAIQRIAASVNAVAGVTWTGQLFVAPIPDLTGTASLTLNSDGTTLPPVAGVEQIAIDPPAWRLAIESEITWDVHALSDVAFTAVLVDRGAYSGTETYREGHIVQNQSSSWIYTNPTPAAGNAPPTLPTTSNSFWRVLAEVGPTGATGATGAPGTPGAAGLNNAAVFIFQRATSAPATPSATATYTFATGAITGLNNGWSASVPAANGQPLWVSAATASSTGASDTIASGEWAAPVIQAQDGAAGATGATGAAGTNTATLFLFQRNTTGSAPAVPSATVTYTFATGGAAGINNGWSQTMPADTGGPYLWVTTATALGTASTDTIATGEWATPRLITDPVTIQAAIDAADDNVFTVDEKKLILLRVAELDHRHQQVALNATALGISSSNAATAKSNFHTFLDVLPDIGAVPYTDLTEPTFLSNQLFGDDQFPTGFGAVSGATTAADGSYTAVSDPNAAGASRLARTVTVAAGSDQIFAIRVKKDAVAAATRTALFQLITANGTAKSAGVHFDTSTGTIVGTVGTVLASGVLQLSDTEWGVYVAMTQPGDSTSVRVEIYPAWGPNGVFTAATTGTVSVKDMSFVTSSSPLRLGRIAWEYYTREYLRHIDLLDKAISESNANTSLQIYGGLTIDVAATYTGDASGSLPKTQEFTARNGLATVSPTWDTTPDIVEGAGTVSMGATSGVLNISALDTDKLRVKITATLNSVSQSEVVTITKRRADPPTGGGGAGDTGSVSVFASVTSSTWVLLATVVRTATGTSVTLSAPSFECSPSTLGSTGTWNVEMKWERENGATDVQIGTTDNSNPDPFVYTDGESQNAADSGYITANETDTGRTAGVQYTYYLWGRLSSGSKTVVITGTASAT